MKSLIARAFVAYFKHGGDKQPSISNSVIYTGTKLKYVILANDKEVLAVYRYIEQRDKLKRLRRIPKEIIEEHFCK